MHERQKLKQPKNTPDNSFPCDICKKLFKSKSNRYKHERGVHGEPTHFCDNCDYKTTRPERLRKHKENVYGNSGKNWAKIDPRPIKRSHIRRK